MRVSPECAPCLLHRGYLEILEATENLELRFKAMSYLLRMLAENFHPNVVPAVLGTMRERIIKDVTGNNDPMAKKKMLSNMETMRILPFAEKFISEETGYPRFRRACLCAIVGNIIEFDIPGHAFNFNDLYRLIIEAEQDLVIDDIHAAFSHIKKAKLIVYLADNSGEIALDKLFIRELRNIGCRVIVAVKEKPVCNDATLEDALFVGINEVADKVITTGGDTMGLIISECSREFLEVYEMADLIIAKGMANAETITEMKLKAPHFLLLRAKCGNVAGYFGVERNKNVAKLLYPY
ncbi:MAG: ARMT1-like domain-containing protein [Candidatus Bathyarchaeia archaeon]